MIKPTIGFKGLLSLPLLVLGIMVTGVIFALVIQVSPSELWQALKSEETLFALRFSLTASAGAMSLAVPLGIGAGYFLSRRDFFGKRLLDALLDLPLVMPPLIAGVGLLFLFGRGLLGEPLARMGLELVFTPWGAVVAQAFIATPIIMRNAKAAFESVNPGYQETAMVLGLAPWRVFFRVNLPLAGRSVFAGVILAWARTMGEFGATLMVAGATRMHTESLPVAVYLNLASGELGIAVSCALVLLLVCFGVLVCLRFLKPEKGGMKRSGLWPGSV
ncbi:ABC transporter permease [Dethiosulfatarculus sandiegensis]|uniref:Molybdate ABC transporter permease n=1 Tax=Dethiosulfatarculus sandiegensis TaxID=1429043 RepID=A0A0D2JBJ9_9BACT|nr:ABC transporter permease [Dethiosulfatarculus sandiegensis]KIX13131.1 molybdate ABC transporter permease [Dethiosulfatarculus sandiegensis]